MMNAKVIRVIDGDTFEVNITGKVRMDFIDAPESKGIEKVKGLISKEWLKNKIEGKTVQLDIKEIDMYSRFLATVFLNDENINGTLLKEHLAEVYSPANHDNGKED